MTALRLKPGVPWSAGEEMEFKIVNDEAGVTRSKVWCQINYRRATLCLRSVDRRRIDRLAGEGQGCAAEW